jgi:hypothetical protein
MPTFIIELTDEEIKLLEKRAKQNLTDSKKLAEDIIRRSLVSYKKSGYKTISGESDDKLINIFSRSKKGRKGKK